MITLSYDVKKVLDQYEKHFGKFVPGNHEREVIFFETLVFNMGIPAQAAQEITKQAIVLRATPVLRTYKK